MRQKGVLLAFVEAVHLIDEHDGAAIELLARHLRPLDGLADVLDAGHHGGERDHFRVKRIGEQSCQGCFADARRPPENHRVRHAGLNGVCQRLAFAQQMRLSDHFGNGLGSQAFGQRCVSRRGSHAAIVASGRLCTGMLGAGRSDN